MLAVSALRASSKALTALSIAVWFSAVSVAVALPLASTSGSAVVIAVLSLSNFSLIIAFCFLLKFSFCVLAIGSRSFNLSAFSLTVFSTGSEALPAFGSVTLTLFFTLDFAFYYFVFVARCIGVFVRFFVVVNVDFCIDNYKFLVLYFYC